MTATKVYQKFRIIFSLKSNIAVGTFAVGGIGVALSFRIRAL